MYKILKIFLIIYFSVCNVKINVHTKNKYFNLLKYNAYIIYYGIVILYIENTPSFSQMWKNEIFYLQIFQRIFATNVS